MAGLIGTGQIYRQQAEALAEKTSDLAVRRKEENQMMDAAHKQQQGSLMGTGAAIGMMAGGPVGALAGAGIGYIAGAFL